MTARLPAHWVPPISDRQSGLFTAQQALAAGATPAQVRRRRETGRWVPVNGTALILAGQPISPWLRAQAAALTWPDSVVCLASAAVLHGLPVTAGTGVHVIVPHRRAAGRGLVPHRMRLSSGDVVRDGSARVTSRPRTLFDCIGRLPDAQSETLMTWAITRDLISREELEATVMRRPLWWGNARRRQALLDTADGALSAAERRVVAILRDAGIDGWKTDQRIRDAQGIIGRADILFHDERLVLEIDGYRYHDRTRFQADRTRQNRLVAAGYTVLRFTWLDITEQPWAVATQVRNTLALLRRP